MYFDHIRASGWVYGICIYLWGVQGRRTWGGHGTTIIRSISTTCSGTTCSTTIISRNASGAHFIYFGPNSTSTEAVN